MHITVIASQLCSLLYAAFVSLALLLIGPLSVLYVTKLMHIEYLCVTRIYVKLFDDVTLYLFCLLGLDRVVFVQKMLG